MPKNWFFQHIWLKHILGTIVFHQCANFHEKILSTGREIQGMPFFSDVPAIFRKFQLQKSVYLTNEPCLMLGMVISNVFK